jgi:hypothetical protein
MTDCVIADKVSLMERTGIGFNNPAIAIAALIVVCAGGVSFYTG